MVRDRWKMFPWLFLVHCVEVFWQVWPGISRAPNEHGPCCRLRWTSGRGNGNHKLDTNWWDALICEKGWGGIDADSSPMGLCVQIPTFPLRGQGGSIKGCPCSWVTHHHTDTMQLAYLEATLPDNTTLFCKATDTNRFLSCDQIDYSFLHKNVCHCQHQKTFLLSSGSTCLIDLVPSEYFTHTKHLKLSDFKSKVSRATKQYSTHLIWLFLFFLVIIELCKSSLDPVKIFSSESNLCSLELTTPHPQPHSPGFLVSFSPATLFYVPSLKSKSFLPVKCVKLMKNVTRLT